jgi:hypothetical protein
VGQRRRRRVYCFAIYGVVRLAKVKGGGDGGCWEREAYCGGHDCVWLCRGVLLLVFVKGGRNATGYTCNGRRVQKSR